MFGRGICEKYQSRDEQFPEGNLVSRMVFFANTHPNMIYLFNYTEYYLEHWLNKCRFQEYSVFIACNLAIEIL
jgi:hypothetical protein